MKKRINAQATKAVIFARVSSKEQEDNNSLDAQVYKMKEYCTRKGFEIIKEIRLVESSNRGEREQFYEMIEFIRKQKESVALICDAVDRLQRSFKEVPILEELRVAGRLTLHFLRENQILDRKANSAQLMAYQMFVMMSASFANSISDNVNRGFGEKRRNGEVLGHVPIGYLNKEKDVVLDEVRSILVKKCFEDYATGSYSCSELAFKYEKLGLTNLRSGKMLSNSQIDRMISHPFYYGMLEDVDEDGNDILREHKYPRIISKELFDKCQNVKRGRGHKRYKRAFEEYLFKGILKCSTCGCTYSSYKQKGKYVYLRPVNKKKIPCDHITSIAESHLLPQLINAIKKITIPKDIIESMKSEVEKELSKESKETGFIIEKLKKEREVLKNKIHNWNLRCADDLSITSEERNEVLRPLKQNLSDIEDKIAKEDIPGICFKSIVSSLIDIASKAVFLFNSSHLSKKREFLNLIGANFRLSGETLLISYAKPFDLFAKYREFQGWRG